MNSPEQIPIQKEYTGQLSKEEERELLSRMKRGDKDAHDKLIMSNLWLVKWIACKNIGKGVERDDLDQEGFLGLEKALKKFDLKYNNRVSTYAVRKIKEKIEEALRQATVMPTPRYIKSRLKKINKAYNYFLQEGIRNPTLSQIAKRAKLEPDEVEKEMNSRITVVSINEELKAFEGLTIEDTIPDSTQIDPMEYLEQQENQQKVQQKICGLVGCEEPLILLDFWKGDLKLLDVFNRRKMMKSIVTGTYNTVMPEEVLFLYFRSDPFYKRNLWRRLSSL